MHWIVFKTIKVFMFEVILTILAQSNSKPCQIDILDTTIDKVLTSKRSYSAALEDDTLEKKKKSKNELANEQKLEKYILKNGFDLNDTDHIKIRKKLQDEYAGFESKIISCK